MTIERYPISNGSTNAKRNLFGSLSEYPSRQTHGDDIYSEVGEISSHISESHTVSTFKCSKISSFSDQLLNRNLTNHEIKELLSEKLHNKYTDVIRALKNFDGLGTGKVLPTHLKRVLQVFCCPCPMENFDFLVNEMPISEDGLISYEDFILKLVKKPLKRCQSHHTKQENSCSTALPVEELEFRIKYKISQDLKNVIRSLWLYDYNRDGFIQKKELQRVLENFCFKISNDQFTRLWNHYDLHNEKIVSYKDFLMKLGVNVESFKRYMPRETIARALRWIDPTFEACSTNIRQEQLERRYAKEERDNPDTQGKQLNDVIMTFKQKTVKNAPLLLRAFKMMDPSCSGCLHVSNFHRTLNFFVMPMSFALFMQLMENLGIAFSAAKKISWYEFLKHICVPNSLAAKECSSDARKSYLQTFRDIAKELQNSGRIPNDVFKKVFTRYDQNNKMIITRDEFKHALDNALICSPTQQQYRELMMHLDPNHTNLIDCNKFLQLLNNLSLANANKNEGTATVFPLNDSQHLNCQYSMLQQKKLKEKIKQYVNKKFHIIEKALFTLDAEETGYVAVSQMRNILDNFCFNLSDSQFLEILEDFSISHNNINYNDFLNFYQKSPSEGEKKWVRTISKLFENQADWSEVNTQQSLIACVVEAIIYHKDVILEEFKSLDYANLGIVSKEDFQQLVNRYVFRMNAKQFNTLWQKLPKNELGYLQYRDFLHEWSEMKCTGMIKHPSSRMKSSEVSDVLEYSKNPSITVEGLQLSSRPKELQKRPHTASSSFSNSKKVFGSCTRSYMSPTRPKSAAASLIFTEKRKFSGKSASLENVNLNQKKFENNLIIEGKKIVNIGSLKHSNVYPEFHVKKNNASNKKVDNLNIYETNEKCIPKLPTKKNEDPLKDIINKRWQDILRRCRQVDQRNSGTILGEHLIEILKCTGISMPPNLQDILSTQHAINYNTEVNYWRFIQKFILFLHGPATKIYTNRNTDQTMKGDVSSPDETPTELYKILLSVRDKVIKNWKFLRQAFHKADSNRCGAINFIEFRKILNQIKINLSEDQAFYLVNFYDQNLTGKICYNDFLKAFLKS